MNGYDQVYVDQMDADIVAVTRHNPESHETVVLVAFTAFHHPDVNAANYQRSIKALEVEGTLDEIIFEATLTHVGVKCVFLIFKIFSLFLLSLITETAVPSIRR